MGNRVPRTSRERYGHRLIWSDCDAYLLDTALSFSFHMYLKMMLLRVFICHWLIFTKGEEMNVYGYNEAHRHRRRTIDYIINTDQKEITIDWDWQNFCRKNAHWLQDSLPLLHNQTSRLRHLFSSLLCSSYETRSIHLWLMKSPTGNICTHTHRSCREKMSHGSTSNKSSTIHLLCIHSRYSLSDHGWCE